MEAEHQEKAIDAVRDWCKWLIGLNFSAATGCVIVIERGVGPVLQPFLFVAILLFVLSVLAAALVMGALAALLQRLPLHDKSGSLQNIFMHHIWRWVSVGLLVKLQFGFFAFGVLFFLIWVALKPPA